MSHPYVVQAKRDKEGCNELCVSAGEALVCAEELRECNWSDIAFVNDLGDEVPSSAVRRNAADDQAQTAQRADSKLMG